MSPKLILTLFSFRRELMILLFVFVTSLIILPIIAFAMIVYLPRGILLEFREAFEKATIPIQYVFGVGEATDNIIETSIWPMRGYTMTEYSLSHPGIDISTGGGIKDAVRPFLGGIVEKIVYDNSKKGYGNYIIIDHGDGLTSLYAHLDQIYVEEDQKVTQNDDIGLEGNIGRVEGPTGIHLHFEVRTLGIPRNPKDYIQGDPLYDLNKV